MKYFTFRKVALAHKAAWQKLKFLAGKGYYLVGQRPMRHGGEQKNEPPFTTPVTPVVVPASQPITMYDSIDISQIPRNAQAVAGYVNGRWPTYPALVKKFPHAHVLSIAVTADHDADCLDVERGDATIGQAPPWVKRQLARGVKRPALYTSVSNVKALLGALASAGISPHEVRIISAHYTFKPHLCSPACGFGMPITADATQYHDHALGKNLDASLVSPSFFGPEV